MDRKLGVIIVLALALRLVAINQSFWMDEAAQALESVRPFNEQFAIPNDFHPPGYHVIVHLFTYVSIAEWWLRLSSVLAGVSTVIIVYLIGKEFNVRIARWAALFLAVAPYHIYYSQELRTYAWSALCSSVLIYALLRRNWRLHTLAVVGGLYTLYLFPFMILVEVVWLLFTREKQWKSWMVSTVAGGICFLPWLPSLWQQLEGGRELPSIWPAWSALSSVSMYKVVPLTYAKFVLGRITFESNIVYGILIGVSLPFVGLPLISSLGLNWKNWLGAWGKQVRSQAVLIWLWLGVPFVVAMLFSLWLLPINGPWRLLYILPAMYLLIAIGIDRIQFIKVRAMLNIMVVVISLLGSAYYLFSSHLHREDWAGASRFLRMKILASSQPTVIVNVFPEPFAPMEWYASDLPVVGVSDGLVVNPATIDGLMLAGVGHAVEVYYFEYLDDLTDSSGYVLSWLDEHGYREKDVYDFRGIGFIRHFALERFGEYANK